MVHQHARRYWIGAGVLRHRRLVSRWHGGVNDRQPQQGDHFSGGLPHLTYLQQLAWQYGTDKADHGYCTFYERHLASIRELPVRLLEIGTYKGASLTMWAGWLQSAHIVGVDIDPLVVVNGDRIETVVGDFRDLPPDQWDVVVDDGSHAPQDVIDAWRQFWPQVRPGGWYVIEDVLSCPVPFEDVAELHVYPSSHPDRLTLNQAWRIVFARKRGISAAGHRSLCGDPSSMDDGGSAAGD